MKLRADGTVREGRAVDCRDLAVDGDAVAAAIRDEAASVGVEAAAPGPVHDRIGHVRPGIAVSLKTALAVAARSRGLSAPQDEEYAEIQAELTTVSPPESTTADARRAVASAGSETDELRERVAELRGRARARRDRGGDAGPVEAELRSAVRELSETETTQVAARQRLEAATATARESRDRRDRRLSLEDRAGNLRRAARAHLREQIRPAYERAVAATPWETSADPFAVDDVTAALAIGRVADLRAPLVLECEKYRDAAAAAAWLDAPVIRL